MPNASKNKTIAEMQDNCKKEKGKKREEQNGKAVHLECVYFSYITLGLEIILTSHAHIINIRCEF